MDKRRYILKILEALIPHWSPAKGFKILVETGELTDEVLDSLIQVFEDAIKSVDSQKAKDTLQKSLEIIKKIKNKELHSKKQDQVDLDELESMLDEI